jgi:hypothetical protein
MSELRNWQKNVFQVVKDAYQQKLAHAQKIAKLGLTDTNLSAAKEQSEDDLLESLVKQLMYMRSKIKQNCGLIKAKDEDLSKSLQKMVKLDVASFLNLAKRHLLLFPQYNRSKVYEIDENDVRMALNFNQQAFVVSFCEKFLKGLEKELEFATRTRIDGWLSKIPIGGKEKRFYDPTKLVNFALANGLEAANPDFIYSEFVEKKIAAADETFDELSEHQFETLNVDEVKKAPAQLLTRQNQLCTSACKLDPRDGRKKCNTKPYGVFNLYNWDFCD